jgi:hypothetical protein
VKRQHYEAVLAKLLGAAEIDNKALANQMLAELDNLRIAQFRVTAPCADWGLAAGGEVTARRRSFPFRN